MPDVHDLGLTIDSHIPLIIIQSSEEKRALDMVSRLAVRKNIPLFSWTITDGIQRLGFGFDLEQDDKLDDPESILRHIKQVRPASIFVLCDYHPYLEGNPTHVRLLKDIAVSHEKNGHTVMLLSHDLQIPPELRTFTAKFQMRMPTTRQIMNIVKEEANRWSEKNQGKRVKTDNRTLQQLVKNLQGLTYSEARRLARGAIFDDGAISQEDIPQLNKGKFELMEMEGVLSYEYDTAQFADVGGLESLKKWLKQRKAAFIGGEGTDKLESPKGIMLLGVQGSGKSLAAKAVAGMWNLPLLRMDVASLYNKYFGETEKNMRQALQLAELMSPCVLWIDEVEKGLGQGDQDQGVSKRVLGTFLTWMAEHTHPVFIVATANDVSKLPPELMRKGRMDEVFFVDLPEQEVRRSIFRIHLDKREVDPKPFNLELLAQASEGFSGAEIEQSIVAAFYSSSAIGKSVDTEIVLEEINNTQPLSVLMAEDIEALRRWAGSRCVPAN